LEIFCGIDWAESHHDVALVDETGRQLVKRRIGDDMAGFTDLVALLAERTDGNPEQIAAVDVAIETDRGLLVAALLGAGHRVYAVNPKAVDRYRDRHAVSGAKSDPGDALVLAQLLRTDRDAHRPIPANTETGEVVKVLARAHADAVHARQQDSNRLRSLLREFYPAALQAFPDLTTKTALVVLQAAPTPAAAAALSRATLTDLLHAAGRGTRPADAARLAEIFAVTRLRQPAAVETAMGHAASAIVTTLIAANTAIRTLEQQLEASFEHHPDAEILDSFPGLGR